MSAAWNPAPLPVAGLGLVLGLVVGSFLNVVIHRLPRGESVVRPGSRCPACGHGLSAWENVPVLSWLLLRGRCRSCRAPISLRYPALEILTGAVFAGLAWQHGATPETVSLAVLAAMLIAAAGIDQAHRVIPDALSLGGLGVGLCAMPAAHWLAGVPLLPALGWSLSGAALGFGLLWSVGFVHARLAVAAGRTFPHWPGEGEGYPRPGSLDWWTWFPGMGFGDIKLMAAIGAFLGPPGVLETLVFGAVGGLVLGGLAWLATRDAAEPFGFGPALALGALLSMLSPWHLALPG